MTPAAALNCRRKFLRYFPLGFRDQTYWDWERDYKAAAHERWQAALGPAEFQRLLQARRYRDIAAHAVAIESRTNLLFSFEKMALRDAVKEASGAKEFSVGLYQWLHGKGSPSLRFEEWCSAVARLPRKQTRVLTWPLVTVFGFLAVPKEHIFFKPNVTRRAAAAYGLDFEYVSKPNWETYRELLGFAARVRKDIKDLRPRDMIDIQSFQWVQGSDEYPAR